MNEKPAAPAPCIGSDPFCPCQDGDLCHYKDSPDGKTKAMAAPAPDMQPGSPTFDGADAWNAAPAPASGIAIPEIGEAPDAGAVAIAAPAPDAATVDQIMALLPQDPARFPALRAAVEQLEQRALAAEHSATVAKSACLALGERWERAEAGRDALRALLVRVRATVDGTELADFLRLMDEIDEALK